MYVNRQEVHAQIKYTLSEERLKISTYYEYDPIINNKPLRTSFLNDEYLKQENLFNNPYNFNSSYASVGASKNSNSSVILNGTSDNGSYNVLGTITLPAGTYSVKQFLISGTMSNGATLATVRFGLEGNGISLNASETTIMINNESTFNVVLWFNAGGYAFTNAELGYMVVKENVLPTAYQPYNGPIVHQKDIEPVLLWENPNPNSSQAYTQFLGINTAAFKYLIIGAKITTGAFDIQYFKIKNIASTTAYFTMHNNNSGHTPYTRSIIIRSDYDITINGGQSNDDACIICEIHGTNLL
jgi:hypothetical protein